MTKLNYVSIRVPDSSLPRSLPRSRRGCSLRPSVPRCWSKGPGEQRAVAISHPPSILERRRNLTRPGRSPMSSFPILISTDLTHVNIYMYVCMYVYTLSPGWEENTRRGISWCRRGPGEPFIRHLRETTTTREERPAIDFYG